MLLQTAATLEIHATKCQEPNLQAQSTLYIHWTHHPKGIQRSEIHQLYNQTIKPHKTHDRMVVAMSRPRNLRDVLTRTALTLPDNITMQDYINEHRINNLS
jgi:hypothetical protein